LGREAPLQAELLAQANRLVGGPAATLVIDDTALPKKGTHSVGIASQYAGARQERQLPALVSLTLAQDEAPIPIVRATIGAAPVKGWAFLASAGCLWSSEGTSAYGPL
jgi:hypothetical protein